MEKFICHDCGRTLKKDEEYVAYTVEKETFLKCKSCFQKDHVLRNYQKTEVYSRIVGYIRPLQQWNGGKQEEFKDRQEFALKVGC
jgi:ribonucleoside-triphosphate reductase